MVERKIPKRAIKIASPDLQQPDDYSCGLCLLAIAKLYGLGPDSFAEAKAKLGTTADNGTYYGDILKYANELGFDATVKQGMTKEELKQLLDAKIPVILSMQAYAANPADYDDPAKNNDGHYIVAIGYDSVKRYRLLRWIASTLIVGASFWLGGWPAALMGAVAAAAVHLVVQRYLKARSKKQEDYFYFMDPSIICRRGYLSWTSLDKRWHENEAATEFSHHLGIIVKPNGHKPVHQLVAVEIP